MKMKTIRPEKDTEKKTCFALAHEPKSLSELSENVKFVVSEGFGCGCREKGDLGYPISLWKIQVPFIPPIHVFWIPFVTNLRPF